jgi:hypothetical protein
MGMTMVEVSVALLVVALSALAMYQMFITGRQLIMEQYHRRTALERARAIMEDMEYSKRELGKVPESFRGTDTDTLVAGGEEQEPILAERKVEVEYSREIDDETGLPYYSMVRVLYEWEDYSGRDYHVELQGAF